MIAIDTNLLVYAHRHDSVWHEAAREAIRGLAESARWAIPWPCLHEFYNIVTHPRIYKPSSTIDEALTQIEYWWASPGLTLLAETEIAWTTLRDLARNAKIAGPGIHDARIVSLCLQHGVAELWSCDRDFSRFPMLRVTNPLVPSHASERRGRYRVKGGRRSSAPTSSAEK
jgi:uncharacterized protein